MKRYNIGRSGRKRFTRTADKTHRYNTVDVIMRGGIRL